MSSGQPKATSENVKVGNYVMLDHWPYKPFKITSIAKDIGMLWLSNPVPNMRSTQAMPFDSFDEAGYVFAEADTKERQQ